LLRPIGRVSRGTLWFGIILVEREVMM